MVNKKDRLALALDNIADKKDLETLIAQTADCIGIYKIGFEQFIRYGDSLFSAIHRVDGKIFLDMKLHDIPNTVAKAVISAAELGVEYLTIHAGGGRAMMEAAAEAAARTSNPPRLLGVTVLTSIDEAALNRELRVPGSLTQHVQHLAKLAQDCRLSGIVCSAADLPAVKPHLADDFEVVTPGIRPAGISAQDQKRVATPQNALEAGSTMLVIGRAITQAANPAAAAEEIFTCI
ncbi:MAG: orotidine-5'-phosphate decarboxylase [Fibrobacterota bacterium]